MGSICDSCDKGKNNSEMIKVIESYSPNEIGKKTSMYTIQYDINQVYNIQEKPIGAGGFGTIRVATFKQHDNNLQEKNMTKYAIKSINKKKIQHMEDLRQEVEILTTVDHPNIVKFFETYEDKLYFHIVMQLCTGGELFQQIINYGSLSEQKAACYMKQMMAAVNYLHEINICHRDLKPENFLFESEYHDAELNLIDFGLSMKFGKSKLMNSQVGTPYYVAPEILKRRNYGPECDTWSLGIILYVILSGTFPFGGSDDQEIMNAVCSEKMQFYSPK